MSDALSLFTRVHNRDQKPTKSTGWGMFSAKMEGMDEEDKGVFRFVASEPKQDRHRDIVAASWKLENFRANPVMPWGHESWNPPVGKGSVDLVDSKLMLSATFDESDHNPLGQLVAHQYREGFLNAVSVGFISGLAVHRSDLDEDHEYAGPRGYVLQDNELLEVSPVTIPALPSALLQRDIRDHGEWVRMWRRIRTNGVQVGGLEEAAESVLERSPSGLTADAVIRAMGEDPALLQHVRNLLQLPSLLERVDVLERLGPQPQEKASGWGIFGPPAKAPA